MHILAVFPCRSEDWVILDQLAGETELSILVDSSVTPSLTHGREYRLTRVGTSDLAAAFSNELRTVCPDFVLWFEGLHSVRSWHCWSALRRVSPDSLVSLVLTGAVPSRRSLANRLLRLCLDLRVIDHVLIARANAGALEHFEGDPQRIFSLDLNRAREIPDLLRKRFDQEQKSVLWVDSDVTTRCPSMVGLVEIVPRLTAQGWSIRALCYAVQPTEPQIEAVCLPKLPCPSLLKGLQFFVSCNLFRFVQDLVLRRRPARITQSTCPGDLRADICSIHFCARRYLEVAKLSRSPWFRDWVGLQLFRLSASLQQWHLRSPAVQLLLPVSRAIGDAVRQCYRAHAVQKVLPNAFDEQRFNPAVRQFHRASTREVLGYSDHVTVFAFSSYGHYWRKGFFLIVNALQILAERGEQDIRLLVIGGMPQTLRRLRSEIAKTFPEYSRWMSFIGSTLQVEKYLAAADAFLLPSYSEGFCLAEIEAAAMGLPLFVTRHPGTEMIIREGKNGVFLEFDPRDIADKLQAFVRREFRFELPDSGEALTNVQYAETVLSIYEDFLKREAVPRHCDSSFKHRDPDQFV
jgi:glycosyltransferase involved in cell wall biosynthesis